MTATDELRRILDERGVEWWQSVNMLGCVFTRWYSPLFSDEVVAMENGDGELELFSHLMTPEQAIEATLGRGTCRLESMHGYTDPYVATRYVVELSCHTLDDWPESEPPAYCPWCGAKVVDDASVD